MYLMAKDQCVYINVNFVFSKNTIYVIFCVRYERILIFPDISTLKGRCQNSYRLQLQQPKGNHNFNASWYHS